MAEPVKIDAQERLVFLQEKARVMVGTLGSLDSVVAAAYALLGEMFAILGRKAQTISSFVLSLKEENCEETRTRFSAALSAFNDVETPTKKATEMQRVQDVEDILFHHDLMQKEDRFLFSCTQCGECCRKAEVSHNSWLPHLKTSCFRH